MKNFGLTEVDFDHCCEAHDVCYDSCGTDKDVCDLDFKKCLYKSCKGAQSVIGLIETKSGYPWFVCVACNRLYFTFIVQLLSCRM